MSTEGVVSLGHIIIYLKIHNSIKKTTDKITLLRVLEGFHKLFEMGLFNI